MIGLIEHMLQQTHIWNQKLEALSLRERLLVILTPLVASGALCFQIVASQLQILHVQQQTLQHKLATVHLLNSQIDTLTTMARSPIASDPLAAKLEQELQQAEASVTNDSGTLSLMRTLLDQHPKIRLISLKTGSPVSLGTNSTSPLFRLPLELVIQGGYPDVVLYLKQLENLGHLYWVDLDDQVKTYPENEFHLKLFLLSHSEAYLDR